MPSESDETTGLDRYRADLLVGLYTGHLATSFDPEGHALERLIDIVAPDAEPLEKGRYMAAARSLATARRGSQPIITYLGRDMQPIPVTRTRVYVVAPVDRVARPLYEAIMADREAADLQDAASASAATSALPDKAAARRPGTRRRRVPIELPRLSVLVKQLSEAYFTLLRVREELLAGISQESASSPIKVNLTTTLRAIMYDGAALNPVIMIHFLTKMGFVSGAGQGRNQWVIVPGGEIREPEVQALIDAGEVPTMLASTETTHASSGPSESESAAEIQRLQATITTLTSERDAALAKAASAAQVAAELRSLIRQAKSRAKGLVGALETPATKQRSG